MTEEPQPSLLTEIERDLLDDVPVSTVLRKLIILGGYAGAGELREWASRELQGYVGTDDDHMPQYRKVPAIIQIDGIVGGAMFRHQTIGVHDLPEGIRDELSEQAIFRQGVGELEALIITHEDTKTIRLVLPGEQIITRLMDHAAGLTNQRITNAYWAVSTAALTGVLDQVRTRMAQMLGELRAVTPPGAALPSTADANRAISVVIHGKNNHVHVAHAASGGVASADRAADQEGRFWTTSRRIGAVVVGLCTIAATYFAWLQLQSG